MKGSKLTVFNFLTISLGLYVIHSAAALPSTSHACEYGPEDNFRVQSPGSEYEAAVDVPGRAVTVYTTLDKEDVKWTRSFTKADPQCTIHFFSSVYLLDHGQTIVNLCKNFEVSSTSDPALIFIRKDSTPQIVPASAFVEELVHVLGTPDAREKNDAESMWLQSIDSMSHEQIVLTTARGENFEIDVATGEYRKLS